MHIGCLILVLCPIALWLQVGAMESCRRRQAYEYRAADRQQQARFLKTFLPDFPLSEIIQMDCIERGGHEPAFLAKLRLTSVGLDKLRNHTDEAGTYDFARLGHAKHFTPESEVNWLADRAKWWDLGTTGVYEVRTHEIVDRFAAWLISSTSDFVYVEAIVH